MHGLHGLTASSRLPAANCCSTASASTATPPVLTMASSTQKTRYVGEQGVQLAGAYYEADFDFEEHARAVAPLLERRLEEARRLCSTSATVKAAQMAEGGKWESFYQTHEEAKFYKLRVGEGLMEQRHAWGGNTMHVQQLTACSLTPQLPGAVSKPATHITYLLIIARRPCRGTSCSSFLSC